MLRKHTNDESTPVQIVDKEPTAGPCACPQPSCQSSKGEHPYDKGYVVFEIFGGYSGNYLTSVPCKCCDGKGYLGDGELPYQRYCQYVGARDISTGYPSPIPMSKRVYESITVKSSPSAPKKEEGCYIATAIYGNYEAPEVQTFRRFRDEHLLKSKIGKTTVKVYYDLSPRLVKHLQRHQYINQIVRLFLNFVYRIIK